MREYLPLIRKSLTLQIQNINMNIFDRIQKQLESEAYTFERVDFERPWGGFFVLNEEHKEKFINEYFGGVTTTNIDLSMKLSPKVLVVAPNKRLSWQYHHRRSELWQVTEGTVGVIKSDTDEEQEMKTYTVGDRIQLAMGERHRLVGLEDYGIVAEIWIHEDSTNPSDEDDIVRLQDDFGR